MTVDEAIDRLITIDQLPEVGPDLVNEADECLDLVLMTSNDADERRFAITVFKETMQRAVAWNP